MLNLFFLKNQKAHDILKFQLSKHIQLMNLTYTFMNLAILNFNFFKTHTQI